MQNLWKQPARLWRRRDTLAAPTGRPALKQLDAGSLEDMIRRALARVAQVGASERDALFIDIGQDTVLAWSEIRKLGRAPDFPVEI